MAYSREYLKNVEYKSIPRFEKFSVTKQFQKLKPGQRINLKCEGYEFDAIINRHNECYVLKNEREVLFRDIAHIDIEKRNNISVLLYIVIPVFIFLAWYFSFKYIQSRISQPDARGQFGDTFGAINALFSGLAFGGIIVTIILQMRELRMQRKELKDTRKEFEMQNSTMKLQRFENTFFNLISNHSNLMDILQRKTYSKNQMKPERYEVLDDYAQQWKNIEHEFLYIISTKTITKNIDERKYPSHFLETIKFYYPIAEDTILITEFISNSEVDNKYFYYRILKNSMSISEVELFNFYCEFAISISKRKLDNSVALFLKYLDSERALTYETTMPPKFRFQPKHKSNQKIIESSDLKELIHSNIWEFINKDDNVLFIENLNVESKLEVYKKNSKQIKVESGCQTQIELIDEEELFLRDIGNNDSVSVNISCQINSLNKSIFNLNFRFTCYRYQDKYEVIYSF